MIGNTNDTSFLHKLLLINSQFGKKISLGITILLISSKEFVKTVKSLEDSSALIIDVTKTIEN